MARSLPFYGHSGSKLDLTEKCGFAGTIKTASGRAAIISRWVHAMAEGDTQKAADLFAQLDDAEKQEALTYRLPKALSLPGREVPWSEVVKETKWALTASGTPCSYDEKKRITRGKADFSFKDGKTLVIGDLKRNYRTTFFGLGTLQLHAAGIALAQLMDCEAYLPCLWYLDEGALEVGHAIPLDSTEAATYWARVKHAAQNQDGPATGEHCSRCYGRMKCPEYILPAVTPESWLAPLSGNEIVLDDDKATELILKLPVLKQAIEHAEKAVRAYVKHGGVVEHDGKRYAPVICNGRKSLNQKALEEAIGDLSPYMRQGAPYEQWKWMKVKP